MDKVLVIDDSPFQAAQLKDILDDLYDVTVADTAAEGLRCLGEEDYSLILLDVVMPDMDGFTMLKKLQEDFVTKGIPVIMITSLPDLESEQLGLTLGAVDYIAKPFNPLIVRARVGTHVRLYNYWRQIRYQSKTDHLTGIANRWHHDCYSMIKWNEAVRLQITFSICMIDIDYFKEYNDAFGHSAGDRALVDVARVLYSYLHRGTDFLARYGGEEFVAFHMGGSTGEVFEYLKKVRKAVESLHIPHNPSVSEWVTVSVGGVTVIPREEDAYPFYLDVADKMLYEAKKYGRNRVVWSNGEIKQMWES